MNTKIIAGTAFTGLVLATGIAGMVSAQSAAEATGLSEEQIIEIALTEVPGDVLEVELEQHRGEQVFEIEILSEDGEEVEVEIAAETGDVLRVRAEGDGCDEDDEDDEDEDDDRDDADEDEGEDA